MKYSERCEIVEKMEIEKREFLGSIFKCLNLLIRGVNSISR
jgi:hypothetical protein